MKLPETMSKSALVKNHDEKGFKETIDTHRFKESRRNSVRQFINHLNTMLLNGYWLLVVKEAQIKAFSKNHSFIKEEAWSIFEVETRNSSPKPVRQRSTLMACNRLLSG